MRNKSFRIPVGVKVALFLLSIAALPAGVCVLYHTLGAGPAVLYAMVFVLFTWPHMMRFGVRRLYAIRNAYVAIVRMDKKPIVPVGQVMGLYALIFSPSFLLTFISLALPWSAALGIFFIPAFALLCLFAFMHAGAWTEVGLKRVWYILYLVGLLLLTAGAGAIVNVLTQK